jgi:hypothetical protein
MNFLRVSIIALCSLVFLASSASPQSSTSLCELIQHPEKYNGQLVKIRATWVYGFEWSYVHCLDCDSRVWLDTSDLDEQSQKAIKHIPKGAGIVNIDVEGVFRAGDSFGHLGGYRYQLTAHTIAHPTSILRGMGTREEVVAIEQKCACGGLKPR